MVLDSTSHNPLLLAMLAGADGSCPPDIFGLERVDYVWWTVTGSHDSEPVLNKELCITRLLLLFPDLKGI